MSSKHPTRRCDHWPSSFDTDEISALFHGAHYCPMEFNGDVDEID
jgi:hypothetical protein